MQLTPRAIRLTPHEASRFVQAMSAWLVKTRRAPSRHSGNARSYGHTTPAMHKLRIPPPSHIVVYSSFRDRSGGVGRPLGGALACLG